MEGVSQNTNVDTGVPMLENPRYRDDIVVFAAAGTMKAGTILARNAAAKLVPFVKGASDTTGVPLAIMAYDLVSAVTGDVHCRPAIAGGFRKERLIIAADGDDRNIDVAVLDALRDYGLVALNCKELGA